MGWGALRLRKSPEPRPSAESQPISRRIQQRPERVAQSPRQGRQGGGPVLKKGCWLGCPPSRPGSGVPFAVRKTLVGTVRALGFCVRTLRVCGWLTCHEQFWGIFPTKAPWNASRLSAVTGRETRRRGASRGRRCGTAIQ